MSLFPAYSEETVERKPNVQDNEWLANSSYPTPVSSVKLKEENEIKIEVKKEPHQEHKNKKKKKKYKKLKRPSNTPLSSESATKYQKITETATIKNNDKFYIDKELLVSFTKPKTIPKKIRPRYKKVMFPGLFPFHTLKTKKKKIKRYFKTTNIGIGTDKGSLDDETLASKKIEEFNKMLTDNPNDIMLWIKFVNFQDEFYKYQHIQYKSSTERERAADRHKLNILEKAVKLNPGSKELQALWLKIGTSVLPSEEMSKRINHILEDSGGTMVLWLGLLTTTQYSLARCTVRSVSLLFEKLLLNFQIDKSDINLRDKNVLELLFHYGRFLDNCGQWETLWSIVKVNLQFNTKVTLDFNIEVDEKVKALEDSIMKEEKKAVWQLWSQLERIREGFHFLPSSSSVDYPQRCVLPDEVVNFTWHFHPELHFQLIVSSIVLMKVPLLPSTHTMFKLLTPNMLPWVYDSPEFILSSLLSSPAVKLQFQYLSPLIQLSRGPQYLRRLNGQKEFLDLIAFTFEACLKVLEGKQKMALSIWWLHFERWLQILSDLKLISLPENRKTSKKFFKDFLENEENRDNLLYYKEYSLLLFNQGNTDLCIKTLKTVISTRPPVLSINNVEERRHLTAVYKCLCEVLIATNKKKEATNLLINLGNGEVFDAPITIQCLLVAERKFKQLSIEVLEQIDYDIECCVEDFMLPNFAIDWISCYFWLIALTKTAIILRSTFDEFFTQLNCKAGLMAEQIRECLWETVLAITWTFERCNLLCVKDILNRSYSCYPNNFKILNFMADSSLEDSRLWLSIRKTFLSPSTTTSCVFLICVALNRYQKDKENYCNRMKNIFHDLAVKDGKLSSIIHCLRLRYLFEIDDINLEKAQLQALEACPWCKSIYTESILLLPAKLTQLTDVLIEKELKIHITPDEIQAMRD